MIALFLLLSRVISTGIIIDDNAAPNRLDCCEALFSRLRIFPLSTTAPTDNSNVALDAPSHLHQTFSSNVAVGAPSIISVQSSDFDEFPIVASRSYFCNACCTTLCTAITPLPPSKAPTTASIFISQESFSFKEALLKTFHSEHTFEANSFNAFPTLTNLRTPSFEAARFERKRTNSAEEAPLPDLISPISDSFLKFELKVSTVVEDFASAFLDTNSPVGCAQVASSEPNIKGLKAAMPVMEGTITTVTITNKVQYNFMLKFDQETTLQFHLRQLGQSRITKLSHTHTPLGTSTSKEHLDLTQTNENEVTVKYFIQCIGNGQVSTPDKIKECEDKNHEFVKKYLTILQKHFS